MRKVGKFKQPESWEEITIKQFSDYHKALTKYNSIVDAYKDNDKEMTTSKDLATEAELYGSIMVSFSKADVKEVNTVDYGLVKEYVDTLTFLFTQYEAKGIKSFIHNDVEYSFPEDLRINTKFGQYVNALQAESVAISNNDEGVEYLSNQLAHMISNGESWDESKRDELATEFLNLPSSIGFEFGFFLTKQLEIYSLALLEYQRLETLKTLPFTKRIMAGMVGLKRYMNLPSWESLIFRVRLRLIQLRLRIQGVFSCTSTT